LAMLMVKFHDQCISKANLSSLLLVELLNPMELRLPAGPADADEFRDSDHAACWCRHIL
jgi:hypothetical protein